MKLMGVELVFFFGPPYAGKTLFYLKHYQATHHRVCPSAILDSDHDITLRWLILKIVNILKKGQSVVLDDENELKHTRASYINLIKTKVPDCKLLCIEFLVTPIHGRLQCDWAREWNIVQVFLGERKISKINPLEKERKLFQWFEEEKIDAPCDSEGLEVSRAQIGLYCDSPFKFEIPALIMQVEILNPVKTDTGPSSIENISTVINTWSSVNRTGRVIFLGDMQHSCRQAHKDTGEETCYDECLDHVKERLRQLALKVETPLYFALVDYSFLKYPFILPPRPGPIAWIQRLHAIDITHKSSLYVCTTEAHTKMAQSAGLSTFNAKKVLNNPKIVTAISCRARQSAIPLCVSESTVCYYGSISLPSGLELELLERSGSGTRPPPHIPLLDKARTACKEMELPCIVTEIAMGRCHGVCFKNLEKLEKYQEAYKKTASPTDEVLCTPFKPYCVKSLVSSEPADEQSIITSVQPSAKDKQEVNTDTCHRTILKTADSDGNMQGLALHGIKIELEDIERLALSESRYRKGKAIQHLIKNLSATPDNDEDLIHITCTCKGSQGQNYDVSAIIGNTGVKQAKCSCLDAASQAGQCKHVVAMLLKNINKDAMMIKKNPSHLNPLNPVSQPETNECGKHSKSFKRKRKSSKRNSGRQNTVYVMSSQELLETASQILQEHNQSHEDKTEDGKETEVFSHKGKTSKDISLMESRQEAFKKKKL